MNPTINCGFNYNSRVTLNNGTNVKIGKIVNNKTAEKILSYDLKTKTIEPKKILEWKRTGGFLDSESFLQIVAEKYSGSGRTNISCSPSHIIFKSFNHKDIMVEDLNVGDEILIAQRKYLNEDRWQIAYGSALGDGSIRMVSEKCAQLRFDHGQCQKEYAQWKQKILGTIVSHIENDKNAKRFSRYAFDTIPLYELKRLVFRENKCCTIPKEIANNLNILGLTIWYLDDGTFGGHYKKWGNGNSDISCVKFKNRDIMEPFFCKVGLFPRINSTGFHFNSVNTKKLHELICEYVPPCMEYKIHPSFRGRFRYKINNEEIKVQYDSVPSKIIKIYKKPPNRSKIKFDLIMEDNARYLVDGAVVYSSAR